MNIPVLITGMVLITAFSWLVSVRHGRYHGIARFFSFGSIFMIVLLNAPVWFRNPLSVIQIISWVLLTLSLWFAVAGFILLKKIGKPAGGNFENTSVIVRTGLYKYIRHPLYLSLFLLGTGAMMKNPGATQLLLGTVNLAAVWITAKMEEKEMIARFGDDYREYMKQTSMFIPFIL